MRLPGRRAKPPVGMGLQPAQPGCGCRLCRPEPTTDPGDAKCIDNVLRFGWHVTLVHAGDGDEVPSFAYTVGLPHRGGHPELVVSGLKMPLMHSLLNGVAERVLSGDRVQPGDLVEGALRGVPLLVEGLSDEGLRQTVTWSGWFHRRAVPAVQLVWPDVDGLFAWQPGASPLLDERQPPSWRVAQPRVGALAPDPPWPLPIPPEALVITCSHVMDDGEPVLLVSRAYDAERGEEWQILCGGNHRDASTDEGRLVHAAHLVRGAPSIREVADLGVDETAWRARPGAMWQRRPADPD